VTWSDKIGLLKLLETFYTHFAYSLPLKTIDCTSSEQQSFLDSVLLISGELQYGWVVGAGGRQDGELKNGRGKCMEH